MKTATRILCLALVSVLLCATLVACAPASDPEKAASALKDAGYTVDTTATKIGVKLIADDVTDVVSAVNLKTENAIIIIYFESSSAAKDAEEEIKKYTDEAKSDDESDWVFKRSGKMIYAGTKDAVKDAR